MFFLQWLRDPGRMGAFVPTSRHMAQVIARQIPPEAHHDTLPVIELGGGTGAVTEAILATGLPAKRLFVLERDPELAELLRTRFPGTTVICGDATELTALLAERGVTKAAAVVSGLPLLLFPPDALRKVVEGCFSLLNRGRPVIQFTYGFKSPIPLDAHNLSGQRTRVWRNIPPAFVWTFRRRGPAPAQ